MRRSHPAWGAWIEILNLKVVKETSGSRTPHGVRGLKCLFEYLFQPLPKSHPAWGAWIEIPRIIIYLFYVVVAPRMGCVD